MMAENKKTGRRKRTRCWRCPETPCPACSASRRADGPDNKCCPPLGPQAYRCPLRSLSARPSRPDNPGAASQSPQGKHGRAFPPRLCPPRSHRQQARPSAAFPAPAAPHGPRRRTRATAATRQKPPGPAARRQNGPEQHTVRTFSARHRTAPFSAVERRAAAHFGILS